MFGEKNGRLFYLLDQLSELVILGLVWLLCSLPVVTLGASCAALYQSIRVAIRGGEGNAIRVFFGTWKENLGKGLVVTILYGILFFMAGFFCLNAPNPYMAIPAGITAGLLLAAWMFFPPMLAGFSLNPFQYFQASVFFAFRYIGKTLLLLVTLALCAVVFGIFPFLLPVLAGLYGYYSTILLEPLLKEYAQV